VAQNQTALSGSQNQASGFAGGLLTKAFTIAANYFVTQRSDLVMSATWKIPSKYVTLIELAGNSSSNDELPEGFGER
jgi:hypothetical protein